MRMREIKNKINLIQNIYYLTQALELIAATKLKKLKNLTLNSRPFARKAIEILIRLLQYQKFFRKKLHYFQPQKSNKILAIVFASDRGFCGLYNKNIFKYAENEIEKLKKTAEVELITIGKKAANFFKNKNYKIKIEFPEIKEFEEKEKSDELFKFLLEFYQKAKYQMFLFFCTHYFTSFFQMPRTVQIFPPEEEKLRWMIKEITGEPILEKRLDYIFEPSFKEIFDVILFQIMTAEIYHAILEARTSEEVSRMVAMKRAMDNAQEIIKDLTSKYNKAKQAQITAEVCEITSAKEALI